jgi:hypothetical protein
MEQERMPTSPKNSSKSVSPSPARNNPFVSLVGALEQRKTALVTRRERMREMMTDLHDERMKASVQLRKSLAESKSDLEARVEEMRQALADENKARAEEAFVRRLNWRQVAMTLSELRRRDKGYLDLRSQIPRGKIA